MAQDNGNQGADDVTKALLDDDIDPRDLENEEEEELPLVDPGTLEGKPKQEAKKGKSAEERIAELTGKWRGTERERDELKAQLEQRDKDLNLMRGQFHELLDVSKKNADAIQDLKETVTKPEDDPLDKELSEITAKIAETRKAIKAAKEALEDTDALEDQLDDLKARKIVVTTKKELAPPKQKKDDGKAKGKDDGQQKGPLDDAPQPVKDFFKEAPWFDSMSPDFDPEMHFAAIGRERKMLADPEWAKKPEAERLADIKGYVEKLFGWKGKGNEGGGQQQQQQQQQQQRGQNQRRHSMVEGGDGQGGGDVRTQGELTPDQKHVAHMLWPGLSPADAEKEYLAGIRIQKSGGR